MIKSILLRSMLFGLSFIISNSALATIYGGIDFPDGASSFADSVIQYNPSYSSGNTPTNSNFTNPDKAIGIPDYTGGSSGTGSVSLGSGGLLELRFINNVLTNSGSADKDLHIFEVGPDVEDTFVAIRPTINTLAILLSNGYSDDNSDGFFDIGKVFGATSSIDIDSIFTGFSAGALEFDAVQLIDDPNEGGSSGPTVGADIDAVGAITSHQVSVPEPATLLLMGFGLAALGYRRKN